MSKKAALPLVFLFALSAAHAADRTQLTTNLIKAQPGSWIRRYTPNGHSWTLYVADNTNGSVTVHYLRHHDGHIVGKESDTVSHDWLKTNAVNPDSPAAKPATVSHKGIDYTVKAVESRLDESPGIFYITDALPASGVVRLDIVHPSGSVTTLWTDAYGDKPDELLLDTRER